MKLDDLLQHLSRPGVTEIALQTGRLPCACVDGAFRPIGVQAMATGVLLKIVVATKGVEGEEALDRQPVRWTFKSKSYGLIDAVAMKIADVVQLRLTRQAAPPAERRPRSPGPVAPASPELEMPSPRGLPRLAVPGLPSHSATATGTELSFDDDRPLDLDLGVRGGAGLPSGLVTSGTSPRGAAPVLEPRQALAPPSALDDLVLFARRSKASDLHVVAGFPARIRLAGMLVPHGEILDADTVSRMILPRVPDELAPRLETHGACAFSWTDERVGRCRVYVRKERTGLGAALRLVPSVVASLAALGLPERCGQLAIPRPAPGASTPTQMGGLVLVAAPPGHGKTTTLAALVDHVNRELPWHVIVVEDPIEFVHARKRALIRHREVAVHTRSYAAAVRAAMRQDPDVLVLGELRDAESARLALAAVERGHLVLTSIDAPTAALAIEALVDLFPVVEQPRARVALAHDLRLVMSQRLLPNSQRTGLVVATELLPASGTLAKLVREGQTDQIPAMQQRGKALGLLRLDDSLAELVRTERVTLETATFHAENPDALAALAARKPAVKKA